MVVKSVRVLVVEDKSDDVFLLLRELRKGGFEVDHEEVETSRELAKRLSEGSWDCVFCDYSLPGVTAEQALETVRAEDPDLPFIVVSGTIGETVAVDIMRAGATDYVLKSALGRAVPALERALAESEAKKKLETAREALGLSEARYARLTENLPDIIYRFSFFPRPKEEKGEASGAVALAEGAGGLVSPKDDRLSVDFVSSAVERITGYSVEEMLEDAGLWLERFDPEDRQKILRRIVAKEYGSVLNVRFNKKDGGHAWLEINSTVVESENQKGTFVVEGVARDVTEQRTMERQLQMARRMEAIGQLAGGLAHDLNNLLTIIDGSASMMGELLDLGREGQTFLQDIRAATERAALLTNGLLAFGRKQVRDVQVLSINEVVSSVTGLLNRLVGEDVEVVMELDPEVAPVEADAGQLSQILLNLASNARDAMEGGGKLTVTTRKVSLSGGEAGGGAGGVGTGAKIETGPGTVTGAGPETETGPDTPGDYVVLTVSDTGTGMDEETVSHIFEPFFTTKERGKGTGLGLATVYGIVKQSGGHILVHSRPGEGTTFEIYLPMVDGEVESVSIPRELKPEDSLARGDETVLVVEDEQVVRKVVRIVLERAGYKPLVASGGQEALDVLRSHEGPVHLLLSDVVMPQMDGKRLADEARSMRAQLKVLFMSGYTDDAAVLKEIHDEHLPMLPKPFTPEALCLKVRRVLDGG